MSCFLKYLNNLIFISKRKTTFLYLFICLLNNAFSQLYNFTNYNIDNGLPQSTVFCIYQDTLGYLWLGTENGAACFDGVNFKTFDQNSGLPGNQVRTIIKGPDNNIWFGTNNGIGIYNGKTWSTITNIDGLQGSSVLKLCPDNQNRVWAATNDAGINVICTTDSVFITHLNTNNGLTGNFVLDIFCDTITNKTWVATIGGINMVNYNKGFIVNNLADSVMFPGNYISCIEKDFDNSIWFGTLDAGAFKLKIHNGKYITESFAANAGITDPRIWDILCLNKQVLFASNDNGFYSLKNGIIQNISIENGLPGNLILSIFCDNNSNIWLGSMGNGLTLWHGPLFVHYTRQHGLPGNKVLAVKSMTNGNICVGTDEKALAVLSFNNDKMQARFFNQQQGFISNQVTSIDFDSSQNLIIGTRGQGIAQFINGHFNYINATHGLCDNNINAVYHAPNSSIYVATNLGFNHITKNKIHTISEQNGLINPEVQTIISDKKGNLWMGTMAAGTPP